MKSYSQTQGFPTAIIMAAKNKKITCSILLHESTFVSEKEC